jgi:hypothetical protein
MCVTQIVGKQDKRECKWVRNWMTIMVAHVRKKLVYTGLRIMRMMGFKGGK